jgi:hypothetical protein
MTNPVQKLIKDILTETKSNPNLEKKLLNDLTKETKEYYNILNNRAKDGQHIAKLELRMLAEKIYKDINDHRIIIEGTFKDSYPKPLDIVYGFDIEKRKQLVEHYATLPNIIHITTRQVTKNDNFF